MGEFITEADLRELWRNGRGSIPRFPADTRFSPAALDFLKAQGLAEDPDELLGDEGQLSPRVAAEDDFSAATERPAAGAEEERGSGAPAWLDAAAKTAPRRKLRNRIDSLRAQVLLAGAQARRHELNEVAEGLDGLAEYCGEIAAAEGDARPVAPLVLAHRSEAELEELGQWPEGHLAEHCQMPGAEDHEILHWLNVVRTQALEVEVSALEAYPSDWPELLRVGQDLAAALNRLGAAAYALGQLFRAEERTG